MEEFTKTLAKTLGRNGGTNRWKNKTSKERQEAMSAVRSGIKKTTEPPKDGNWKPIKEWPGYWVCDDGRVFGKRGMLRPFPVAGYPAFSVVGQGKSKFLRVHREVLKAFTGEEHRCSRHLDGSPANCRLDNLKWGTFKENTEDARRHGTLSGKKLNNKQRQSIKRSTRRAPFLSKKFGISVANVYAIKRGSWT